MNFLGIFCFAAGSKALMSTSVFLIKYFDVHLAFAYFCVSLIGLVFFLSIKVYKTMPQLPKSLWILAYIRFFIRDLALFSVFTAFMHGSVPRVSAIFFSTSFLLPVFGKIFLNIKTSLPQWLCIGLGYVGLLVLLNPFSGQPFSMIDFLVLGAAIALTTSNTLLKFITQRGMTTSASMLGSCAFRCVLSSICLLIFYEGIAESIVQFEGSLSLLCSIILGCCFLQNAAQAMHTDSYRFGGLPFLGIMDLWRFVFDATVGYFIFHQCLDIQEIWGVVLIFIAIFSISVLNWKEDKIKKRSC